MVLGSNGNFINEYEYPVIVYPIHNIFMMYRMSLTRYERSDVGRAHEISDVYRLSQVETCLE